MRFRLVPKSSTLHVWEATTAKRMKVDPHCQRRKTLILLGDPGGRCSELRPIHHGCRALTLALARLSCSLLMA